MMDVLSLTKSGTEKLNRCAVIATLLEGSGRNASRNSVSPLGKGYRSDIRAWDTLAGSNLTNVTLSLASWIPMRYSNKDAD